MNFEIIEEPSASFLRPEVRYTIATVTGVIGLLLVFIGVRRGRKSKQAEESTTEQPTSSFPVEAGPPSDTALRSRLESKKVA